jgi:hypothetical protein
MVKNKIEQELQWQREDAKAAFLHSSKFAPGRSRQEQDRLDRSPAMPICGRWDFAVSPVCCTTQLLSPPPRGRLRGEELAQSP